MTRSDKTRRILEILDELHPQPAIPLAHRDPYTLLVAVLLSAQTTDKMVNRVTPSLFALAATPSQMAGLSVTQIAKTIRTIGLAPTKARHLKAMSQMLLDGFDGVVPADLDALEGLPGVGHKTASVVMAQAFGVPAFPVDTHIHRLAARWGLSDGSSVLKTERDLKRCFEEQYWSRVHLQMIYFGRAHCPARGHDFGLCPICSWAASKRRIAEERRRSARR